MSPWSRRCNWTIGIKAAIAGAAITSAPVVIPSLFVLSALGLAFSLPFGIYLAGYVCADKLMNVLLPLPPSVEEIDDESMESEDLIEIGLGDEQGGEGEIIEEEEEGLIELGNRMEMEEVRGVQLGEEVREDGNVAPESSGLIPKSPYSVVVMAANKERSNKEYEPPNLSSEHLSMVEVGGEGKANDALLRKEVREEDNGEEEKRVKVANGVEAKDKETSLESDVEGEVEEVRRVLQLGEEVREDGNVAPESSGLISKSPYSVVVMAANKESSKKEYEPPNLSSEHLSIVEVGGEGKANDALLRKELREEDNGEEEKRVKVANGVEAEVPRLKSEYVWSAVIVPSKDEDAEILEEVGAMEFTSLGKLLPGATVGGGVTALYSHDERTHSEEKLWDQIFSMRAIVGHKATPQPSLGEEIMALYLLIGVEPPVSLKDAADLPGISNSLQFLKYVIGVK